MQHHWTDLFYLLFTKYNKYRLHGNSRLFVGSLPVLGVKVQMFVDIFYFLYSIFSTCLWSGDLSFPELLFCCLSIKSQNMVIHMVWLCYLSFSLTWAPFAALTEGAIDSSMNLWLQFLSSSILSIRLLNCQCYESLAFFSSSPYLAYTNICFHWKRPLTFNVAGRAHCPVFCGMFTSLVAS